MKIPVPFGYLVLDEVSLLEAIGVSSDSKLLVYFKLLSELQALEASRIDSAKCQEEITSEP